MFCCSFWQVILSFKKLKTSQVGFVLILSVLCLIGRFKCTTLPLLSNSPSSRCWASSLSFPYPPVIVQSAIIQVSIVCLGHPLVSLSWSSSLFLWPHLQPLALLLCAFCDLHRICFRSLGLWLWFWLQLPFLYLSSIFLMFIFILYSVDIVFCLCIIVWRPFRLLWLSSNPNALIHLPSTFIPTPCPLLLLWQALLWRY